MANPARPALIINADDLGYSPGVNTAIADLYQAGLVTSTSLIVNLPHSEAGAAIARRLPGLSVGVHLNLSKGSRCCQRTRCPAWWTKLAGSGRQPCCTATR
ncbi:MAG: ChbG/HpnK family deacetylase [Anaerolineales bacterium]|nr:ChbG/HpnK family deacetylase [Anaerolineales bacterium]